MFNDNNNTVTVIFGVNAALCMQLLFGGSAVDVRKRACGGLAIAVTYLGKLYLHYRAPKHSQSKHMELYPISDKF